MNNQLARRADKENQLLNHTISPKMITEMRVADLIVFELKFICND